MFRHIHVCIQSSFAGLVSIYTCIYNTGTLYTCRPATNDDIYIHMYMYMYICIYIYMNICIYRPAKEDWCVNVYMYI